jgi:hypothetical protein
VHLILALFFGLFGGARDTTSPPSFYVGRASDLGTGRPLYVEEHREVREGERRVGIVTEYKDLEGKLFARRTARFDGHPTVAQFRTEDLRTGALEGADVRGDKVRMYHRKGVREALNEREFAIPAAAAVDAGFNNYVQLHWAELEQGETLRFEFGVPYSLDYYGFRLYKKDDGRSGDRPQMTVVCDIDNFLIRLFVKPIRLTYDANARRLMTYEGISNMTDPEGANYTVRIVFDPYGP